MGRLNTAKEHRYTLDWAKSFDPKPCKINAFKLFLIKAVFINDLKKYFALAALSRSKSANQDYVHEALDYVFRVRVRLEEVITRSLQKSLTGDFIPEEAFSGNFYGLSKKQGISVRFALSGCSPTKLCGRGCYAHDALDASPNAVIRGALNHFIAKQFQENKIGSKVILEQLIPHTKRAINAANKEAKKLKSIWSRAPRIRFAHVGESAAYPEFCNALARQVKSLSNNKVKCIVYTRHKNASKLDPDLFVINFTLDGSSEKRKEWAPEKSRIVYSAFGGQLSSEASVNFLEHHRWSHLKPSGEGKICPSTHPDTTVRTCDAVKCDFCFNKP
jgi:hypothetical protein